jgi:tetratricopeptide (TPR) repeat protein
MYFIDKKFVTRLEEIAKDRPDLLHGEQIGYIKEGMEFNSVLKGFSAIASLLEGIFRSVAQEVPEAAEQRIDYLKAIVKSKYDQETAETAKTLGHLLFACGRFEEAIGAYNFALHFYPYDADVLFKQATSYLNIGNREEGFKVLAKILDLDPEKISSDAEAKCYAVFIGETLFDIEARYAKRLYEFALQIDDSYVPAIVGIGDVYLERSDIDEAEYTYKKALDIAKDTFKAKLGLAHCAQFRDDRESFLEWMDSCLDLDPQGFQTWLTIGDMYWQYGYIDEAIVAYNVAREYNSQHPDIVSKLAQIGSLEVAEA